MPSAAAWRRFSVLEDLELDHAAGTSVAMLQALAQGCGPLLKRVRLWDTCRADEAPEDMTSGEGIAALLDGCALLEDLDIGNNAGDFDALPPQLCTRTPNRIRRLGLLFCPKAVSPWIHGAAFPGTLAESLVKLDIEQCRLTALPPSIGQLVHLEELLATNNKLAEFPRELYTLPQLRVLELAYNALTRLGPGIRNLRRLGDDSGRLDLRGNKGLQVPPWEDIVHVRRNCFSSVAAFFRPKPKSAAKTGKR